MDTNNAENCLVFVTVVDSGKLYSDQTGHFPFTSIRGVKYVFILYLYDTNSVFHSSSIAELEITSYIHTQHLIITSRRVYLSPKFIGCITKHAII